MLCVPGLFVLAAVRRQAARQDLKMDGHIPAQLHRTGRFAATLLAVFGLAAAAAVLLVVYLR